MHCVLGAIPGDLRGEEAGKLREKESLRATANTLQVCKHRSQPPAIKQSRDALMWTQNCVFLSNLIKDVLRETENTIFDVQVLNLNFSVASSVQP